MKFSKRRILLAAAVVVATSIGAAFAYHNLQSEAVPAATVRSDTSTSRALNPNGAEIVVRAFNVQTGATECRDDARRKRLVETKRIPDREHLPPDL